VNFDKWDTNICIYVKGKNTKIYQKSFLVNIWLRNVNLVQLKSSIKFLKKVYKKIKQIKYKIEDLILAVREWIWTFEIKKKMVTKQIFKYRSVKMLEK